MKTPALAILLMASLSSAAAQDCSPPGVVERFTSWVSSYLSKTAPKALSACPDGAVGRISRDQSEGAKYLKTIASVGWFDRALQKDPEVQKFLRTDPRLKNHKDKTLSACVSEGPTLKYLLGLDAGVTEGYDIGEHSAIVLNTYLSQQKFYSDINLGGVSDRKLHQLMLPILALHDIGKGIAVKANNKDLQHLYTAKFVRPYLRSMKFSQKEINLAVALIDHDAIGEYLKPGGTTLGDARLKLQQQAKSAGMSYQNFMKLQQLFYTSDAAAYPYLRTKVFKKSSEGKLLIKDSKFSKLL